MCRKKALTTDVQFTKPQFQEKEMMCKIGLLTKEFDKTTETQSIAFAETDFSVLIVLEVEAKWT